MTTDEPNHRTTAITALTAAALQTYRGPDGQDHRYDFGEIVCHVITTVAANLGGLDALLAGRPGSWEADSIRTIVESTVPEDELLTWRTEPVQLYLNPVDALYDAGIGGRYQAAVDAQYDALPDEQADSAVRILDSLFQQDIREYAGAYAAATRQAAEELGITVPVHIEILEGDHPHTVEPGWDILAEQLHTTARQRTPLPTHTTDYLATTN